ncbi:MAG: FecR domain-containing protein [Lachnospiraceae bacterium]|nr:FecR domain-containing protein [Lachnospiraceae bacterium]
MCAIVTGIFIFNSKKITATVMRLQRIVGTVELFDGNGNPLSLIEKFRLQPGNKLNTRDQSLAGISLDESKIITMDENTEVEFSSTGKKLELNINNGTIFFDVKEHLKADETFDIKTSTMVAGIRGTSGIFQTNDKRHHSIILTDGTSVITGTNKKTGETTKATIKPGEKLTIYLDDEAAGNSTVSFSKEKVQEEDLLALALDAIKKDPSLMDKICAATGFDKERLSVLADIVTTPGTSMFGSAADEFAKAGGVDSIPFLGKDAIFMQDAAKKARESSGGNLKLETSILKGSKNILEKDTNYKLPSDSVDTMTQVSTKLSVAGFTDSEIETIINTVVKLYEENYKTTTKDNTLVANDNPTGEFVKDTIDNGIKNGLDAGEIVDDLLRKKTGEGDASGTGNSTGTSSPQPGSGAQTGNNTGETPAAGGGNGNGTGNGTGNGNSTGNGTGPVSLDPAALLPDVTGIIPPPTSTETGSGSTGEEAEEEEDDDDDDDDKEEKKYTIKFVNYDGSVLQSTKVTKDKVPSYSGTTPAKPADANYTYSFSGWSDGSTTYTGTLPKATANATYTAQFTSNAIATYTIRFLSYDRQTVLQEILVKSGAVPSYSGSMPTMTDPENESVTYTANCWVTGNDSSAYTSLPAASANTDYIAAFKFNVTLETNGGTINSGNVTSYIYGRETALPSDITKDDCEFNGWYEIINDEIVQSDGDVIYSHYCGDKTYYAAWGEHYYNIDFSIVDQNGNNLLTTNEEGMIITIHNGLSLDYTWLAVGGVEAGNSDASIELYDYDESRGYRITNVSASRADGEAYECVWDQYSSRMYVGIGEMPASDLTIAITLQVTES